MNLTNSTRYEARNGSFISEPLDGLQLFEATCIVSVIVISVVLNVSVIAVILHSKHLRRRTTNLFIMNLAVSNSLLAVCIMPLSFRAVVHQDCSYSKTFCTINGILCMTFLVASICTLCCISVDRYFAVVKPMKYKNNFTIKRASAMLISTWVSATFCASLPLTGWSKYVFHPGTHSCSPDWPTSCGYYVFMVIMAFGIPVVILLLTYVMIFSAIRKHDRRVSTWSALAPKTTLRMPMGNKRRAISLANSALESSTCTVTELNVTPNLRERCSVALSPVPSPITSRRNTGHFLEIPKEIGAKKSPTLQFRALAHISAKLKSRAVIPREYKIAKTGFMLFLVFFLSWGPYMVTNNCASNSYVTPAWVYGLTMWLVFASCLLNPLVYAFSSKHIRDAFVRGMKFNKRRPVVGIRRLSDATSTNI